MKHVLIILAVLVACVVFAAESEQAAEQTQRYEVAIDTNELVDGIDGIADVLEKHLSGPARLYYDTTFRRIQIRCIIQFITAIVVLISMIIAAWFCHKTIVAATVGFDSFGYAFGMIVSVICAFIAFCLATGSLIDYLTADYITMQHIIDTAASFAH